MFTLVRDAIGVKLVPTWRVEEAEAARQAEEARRAELISALDEHGRLLEAEARLRAHLRRRDRALPPSPTIEPLSSEQRAAMDYAGRGSGTIDPTRTATPPDVVQRIREQLGDPALAGYDFFSFVLGRAAAGHAPGAVAPVGHPDPAWYSYVGGVLSVLPAARAARALFVARDALRAGKTADEAAVAARQSFRESLTNAPSAATRAYLSGVLASHRGQPVGAAVETARQTWRAERARPPRLLPAESVIQAENAAFRVFKEAETRGIEQAREEKRRKQRGAA